MNDKEFLIKYENLLNKGYCDCNEMNCIDNNSPRRILNIAFKQQKEIDRLNNIINELEKDSIAFKKLNAWIVNRHAPDLFHKMEIIEKLKELKDSD